MHDPGLRLVQAVHPRWSSQTFLVYTGALTVLGAAATWLRYLTSKTGGFGDVVWALLLVLVLKAAAFGFLRRGHRIAAGVFAFGMVAAYAGLIATIWKWFGWNAFPRSFDGFHLAFYVLAIVWITAALITLAVFRFPLILTQALLAGYLLFTDFISGGGTWSAIVTVFVGLVYLSFAFAVDAGNARPYGFWIHVASGLLIGGSLLWFWHGGWFEWLLVVVFSILFMLFGGSVGRSSWTVLGAFGLLIASVHYVLEWTHVQLYFFGDDGSSTYRPWVSPLVFTATGALLIALGFREARRRPQVG
jgi:hypothetical protein